MRVIHLTHGAGNGDNEACLITAINMVIGKGFLQDLNYCVCDVLANFIYETNDEMPEEILGEIYGPLIWELIGTRVSNRKIIRKRAKKLIELSIDVFNKTALMNNCPIIRKPKKIRINTTFLNEDGELKEPHELKSPLLELDEAIYSYSNKNYFECGTNCAESIHLLANVDKDIWYECPNIIREVIKIGDKRPVEKVLDEDELAEKLATK